MKYMDKTEFDKVNVFGTGNPNDAYAGWNLGHLCVVEYDQRPALQCGRRLS